MESVEQQTSPTEFDLTMDKPFRVFISYRRADAGGYAGWLNFSLESHLGEGNIFRDVVALEAGVDFMDAIDRAIRQSDVVLALIGHAWATITDSQRRRRLDDPNDPVRVEIRTALSRRRTVIPILLEGAVMPSEANLPEDIRFITRLNALPMADARWQLDLEKLARRLEDIRNQGQSSRLSGREIYERFRSNDRPPTWVGRSGGAFGKLLRDDVTAGHWKDQTYEVQFGGTSASKNWFPIEDFVKAVDSGNQSRDAAGEDVD